MDLVIAVEDPRSHDVSELLFRHLNFAREVTPAGHVHALDVEALLDPAITFYGARHLGTLVGVGAIKQLDEWHGELKSMHTAESARGKGVGKAMVDHLLGVATARSYERVSLETGTTVAFGAARRLYTRAGFVRCEPFGAYTVNPHSVCMTIALSGDVGRF